MKSKFKIAVVFAVVVLALLSVLVGCNQGEKKPSVDGNKQCKHTYGEWVTTVEATCNDNGSKKRVCSTCKNEDVEVIIALGHDVIEHKAQAVTCTETGWNAYLTCSRCDFTTFEEIKALGHDFEEKFSVDKLPTCTLKGIKSRHCTRCEATTEEGEIDELGHNIVQREASQPTCTGIGWGAYEACTRCDYSTRETISPIGHEWEEEISTDKEPTCTESGSRSIHCTRCDGKTEVTIIPALGHKEVEHGAQAVTCTEIGWDAYVTCARCDYSTYEEITALGHDFEEEFTVDKDTTCTENGSKSKHCTRCEEQTEVTEIPALGHKEVTHGAQLPTCTEIGWKAYVTCSRCEYSTYVEIPAVGHDFEEEFTIDKQATCTENGSKSVHCTRCDGKNEVTEIDALGHNLENHEAQAVTCTEKGWNAYVTCTRCDHSTYEEIPALGHDFEEEFAIDAEATCTEKGSKSVHCTRCEEKTEVTEIDTLGHNLENHEAKAPTCTEVGWNAYATCTRCDYTTYEQIDRMGHDFNEEFTVDKEATCTENGSKSKHCTRCEEKAEVTEINAFGHNLENHEGQAVTCTEIGWNAYATCTRCDYTTYEEISAVGHDWEKEFTIDKEVTCTEKGSKSKHCTRCEEKSEVTEIEALGHDEESHEAQGVTCTEIGWEEYVTCSRCDYTTYEEIEALGHSLENHVAKSVTCTEIGWEEYVTCTRCDYSSYEEIEALGHDYLNKICTVCGELEVTNGLVYTLNEDGETYSVTGIETIEDNVIIIAHTYEGKPVTAIGEEAFRGRVELASVIIQDSVTSIGAYAFYECVDLINVEIPYTVTSIGNGAFYGCENLLSITIPENLTAIGEETFRQCGSLTSVEIPDGVLTIGNGAFLDCDNLTDVSLGAVTIIGNDAFAGCVNLTDVELPDGLTTIGNGAFYGCVNLTILSIPDSVMDIASDAFAYCGNLTDISVGANNTKYHSAGNCIIETETETLILGCATSVIPTDGRVTSIGNYAFSGCDTLTQIEIPEAVTVIGEGAFFECIGLTEIAIHDGVTDLGEGAFDGCTSLTRVELSDGVTVLSQYLFAECGDLTSIIYGGTATKWQALSKEIGWNYGTGEYSVYCSDFIVTKEGQVRCYEHSFGEWEVTEEPNCTEEGSKNRVCAVCEYEDVEIISALGHNYEDNVCTRCDEPKTTIGLEYTLNEDGETYSVTGIGQATDVDVIIPSAYEGKTVNGIGAYAFSQCATLTSVTVPDSVTSMGQWAFSGCSGLSAVYINDIAKWCGITFENSFSNPLIYANNLYVNGELVTDLIIPAEVSGIGNNAFHDCTSITSIELSDSVTSIGEYAFYGCSNLMSAVIGSGLTSIEDNAFFACYKLVEIYNKSTLDIAKGSFAFGEIGHYAKEIYTEEYESKLSAENGYIFYTDGEKKILVAYTGEETELTLPEDITEINHGAFYNCRNLTSVTLGDNAESIGVNAFSFCSALTNVVIGNRVTRIRDYAFYECRALTDINYDGNVSEWQNVTTGNHWDSNIRDYTVYCLDGEVAKDGTVTLY